MAHSTATPTYYLLPAAKWREVDALDHLHLWLDRNMWGMQESTPGRKHLRAGDKVCFYAAGYGVVARATLAGPATRPLRDDEVPTGAEGHTIYRVPLTGVTWLPSPIPIDAHLRSSLDAFQGKDAGGAWAWLVQTTRRVTAHDYAALTGQSVASGPARVG